MQPAQLIQQLTDDLALAERLLEISEAEREALSARELTQLEQLLHDKQPLIDELIAHGADRARLLQARGLPASRDGLLALVEGSTEADAVLALADRLAECLEACRSANEVNGRLIRANQAAVGSALGVLRGGGETADLYDNRGAKTKDARQRPLSQA